MNYNHILLIPAFLLSSSAFAVLHSPVDSVGVEHSGKNTLLLYKVEPGETLFALSRKYNVSVKAIRDANPGMKEGLKVGEIVRIPYTMPASQTAAAKPNPASTTATPPAAKQKTRIHKVRSGEGLYSVARTYHISVDELKAWNHLTSSELKVGQELIVQNPGIQAEVAKTTVQTTLPAADAVATPSATGTHTVGAGEGLSTIAQLYQVSVSDLKKWNRLRSNTLKAGQELIVVAPDKNPSKIAPGPEVTFTMTPAASEKTSETTVAKNTTSGPAVVATPSVASKTPDTIGNKEETKIEKPAVTPTPVVINTSGYVKTVESGVAEAITDGAGSDLFLALHRTAPVGTIMQVRNEMNDQSVFVKVIGKLPDTGDNNKVLIKISKRAYERLGAIDKRFRVQVSYMPQQ